MASLDYIIILEVFNKNILTGTCFGQPSPYQTVCCAPLMFLCDICHIGKDHREGDGKDTGHGDDRKVPPERREWFGFSAQIN